MQSHAAFESAAIVNSRGYAALEYDVMVEGGLSEADYYSLAREDRAKRVAWLILSRATRIIVNYEDREARKSK